MITAATNQACAALIFDSVTVALKPYVKLFFQRTTRISEGFHLEGSTQSQSLYHQANIPCLSLLSPNNTASSPKSSGGCRSWPRWRRRRRPTCAGPRGCARLSCARPSRAGWRRKTRTTNRRARCWKGYAWSRGCGQLVARNPGKSKPDFGRLDRFRDILIVLAQAGLFVVVDFIIREEILMSRVYRYSPLVEALCEFQFAEGEWDWTVPGLMYQEIKETFPKNGRHKWSSSKFRPKANN